MATKAATTKSTAAKAPRKPRATTAKKKEVVHHEAPAAEVMVEEIVTHEKPHLAKGKYVFATGRRKTAVANVRLFSGKGESQVNQVPFEKYFSYSHYQDEVMSPFQRTGLSGDFHFISHINGGGTHSQAQALRHGIATALSLLDSSTRKVLKKNGFLTRDDRKKERKKPGLKRARRSPQWAKR